MEYNRSLSYFERQEQLLKFVEQRQRVTVDQLCDQFDVSPATVRRDLEALAQQGKIERFHGGARAARQAPPEAPVMQRASKRASEKQRIGRVAADLIGDEETVFLGSGTTVLEVARNLKDRRNLTIITNSSLVVNELATVPDITVVCLGGILRQTEMSMIGHITEQALTEVNANKIVMGIRALDVERGLTNDYLPETMTDRSILACRCEIIIVADHTKCGCVSTAFVAPITAIDTLVTDTETPSDFVNLLEDRGIRVLRA